jgi:hypothetical protein
MVAMIDGHLLDPRFMDNYDVYKVSRASDGPKHETRLKVIIRSERNPAREMEFLVSKPFFFAKTQNKQLVVYLPIIVY